MNALRVLLAALVWRYSRGAGRGPGLGAVLLRVLVRLLLGVLTVLMVAGGDLAMQPGCCFGR